MSVLIKGMEMPKKCLWCPLQYIGFCQVTGTDVNTDLGRRADDCPLVEIKTPHGRLIDADELIEDLKHDVAIDQDSLDYEELTEINRRLIQDDKDVKQNAIDLLEHTSCIIEAEGGE